MNETELVELKQDAARYRYLRDTQNNECRDWGDDWDKVGVVEGVSVCVSRGTAQCPDASELDAYIDCAMLLFPNISDHTEFSTTKKLGRLLG